MKKIMSTFVFILLIAGIAYLALFHRPEQPSVNELKNWFSGRLSDIADSLEQDIASDINGEYPHTGKQTFGKQGRITYVLLDKSHARFEISDRNALTAEDIIATAGYQKLQAKVRELHLTMQLEEKQVEGDGVESYYQMDEYVYDHPRYYTVTVEGW